MRSRTNKGSHIAKVIDTTACIKHEAEVGMACWEIQIGLTKIIASAICGDRIKNAGYNGKITPTSLSLNKEPKPYFRGGPSTKSGK